MEKADLSELPLERLAELAMQRALLDEWRHHDGRVSMRVGPLEVTLMEPTACMYLRRLIRRHDMNHAAGE